MRKRRDGGWQIRLLSRCLQSGNVYSVTFGDLKFFLTAQIPHHNDSRNDHDDAYDREDYDHLHQRGRAGSGVHDIVRGLTESLAEKFCNAQIQVVVVSVKIAPEDRLRLFPYDNLLSKNRCIP